MSKTTIYKIYRQMIERCHTKTHQAYPRYGARGIAVCERWRHSFENFFSDMGDRPEGRSIDRFDNNQGYSPDNCYWATQEEQMNNTSATHLLEYNGEKLSISQWSRKLGVSRNRITSRLQRGHSIEEALKLPKLHSWSGTPTGRKYVRRTKCLKGHDYPNLKAKRLRCKICERKASAILKASRQNLPKE